MDRPVKIAPSLLAADFGNLEKEIALVEPWADWLHLDIMDGHFVPNISFGMPVIAALRDRSSLHFDCHLMTTNPTAYLRELAAVGADLVTFHIEAVPNPKPGIEMARSESLDVGLACNPGTPFEAVAPFVELVDVVLIMSVEPGFGGQSFIPEVLGKVESAREWVENRGLPADIQIDGGIKPENASKAYDAGANVFVAGSSVFGADDPGAAVLELRRTIEE